MLVITRKTDEGIIIDGDIEIVILGIEDEKVKLGIEEPRHRKIFRKEIIEGIKQANQEALDVDREFIVNFLNKKDGEEGVSGK